MDIQELIEEAKRRYPIGCSFISAAKSGPYGPRRLSGHRFDEWINYTYIKEWQSIHERDSNGLLYCNGRWAEITEYPKGWKEEQTINSLYQIY